MKKTVSFLSVLLMLFVLVLPASAVTTGVDVTQKVYDYAALFNEEQTADLKQRCADLKERTGNDIVILTIDHNDASSTLAYAEDFYDYNGFGVEESKRGILLIIDMDNRIVQTATTGKGDESSAYVIIDPERLGTMEDAVQGFLKNGDFYGGALSFLQNTEQFFTLGKDEGFWNKYNSSQSVRDQYDLDRNPQGEETQAPEKRTFGDNLVVGLFVAAIVTLIVMCVLLKRSKQSHVATNAYNYAVRDSLQFTRSEDVFVSTNTVAVPIPKDPPSSSSSGGGGGGFHTGSSGTSHGTGGGRSF